MPGDSEKTWIEVSLLVDGEMAEAVAEVLARFAPGGVVVESTQVEFPPDSDFDAGVIGVPSGPLRVYAYLPTDSDPDQPSLEATRRCLEEALWHLGCIRSLPPAQYKTIQETDWSETWKVNFHPIAVGERLMIIPAWLDEPLHGRIPVRIDPGMAFGTGTHPTTQLCMELLEKYVPLLQAQGNDRSMIDLGCGSGILAITALKLGMQCALGVDTDANVIPIAHQNAALNGIGAGLELGAGSLAEIRAGAFDMEQAPIVAANILAPVIIRLLDEGLVELVKPGGVLILSGILEEQLEMEGKGVLPALQRHSLPLDERRQIGDWVALAVRRDKP
jgi:ribosomal protein L11 methyltransferase